MLPNIPTIHTFPIYLLYYSDVQAYIVDNHGSQGHAQCGDWFSLIQGLRFTSSGKYICGYVDSSQSLVQILESYRTATGTSYSNQNLAQSIKSMDENQLRSRFMSPAARPRLFWQMNAGEPTIQYDGVPFMTVGHGTDLPCMQYGGRKKRINQLSLPSGEVVPMDYRMKTGCEAKITIRQIKRFPCAQYNETAVLGIAAVRRERKQILDGLVQRVISGSAKAQERYYMLLPTPMAHNGHSLSEFDPPIQTSQPMLDEIVHHLGSGVTSVSQLQDRLKSFIYTTYGTEPTLHPNDPMYCLSEFEVFRQMYWLYKTGEVIDHDFKSSIKSGTGMGEGNESQQQPGNQAITPAPKNNMAAGLGSIQASTAISTSSADVITSVYSIIMDDTSAHHHHHDGSSHRLDSPGPLGGGQMEDHSITTDQDVDHLTTTNSPATHNLGVVMDEAAMVNQIQIRMGSSSGLSNNLQAQFQHNGASGNTNGLTQPQTQQQQKQQQNHQQLFQQGEQSVKDESTYGETTPMSRNVAKRSLTDSSFTSGNGMEVSLE